jgi:hypothetical protein
MLCEECSRPVGKANIIGKRVYCCGCYQWELWTNRLYIFTITIGIITWIGLLVGFMVMASQRQNKIWEAEYYKKMCEIKN